MDLPSLIINYFVLIFGAFFVNFGGIYLLLLFFGRITDEADKEVKSI